MYLYRQTIILFGFGVPILLGMAVIGLGYKAKSKVEESYHQKMADHKTHRQALSAGRDIETQIAEQREHLVRWNEELSHESASAVSTNIREISEKLPNKEIQQTAFERSKSKSGFGQESDQDAAMIRMAFRGTYRTLQQAFFELETRMPRLQLEELKLAPVKGSASHINFQATYTAWEN